MGRGGSVSDETVAETPEARTALAEVLRALGVARG